MMRMLRAFTARTARVAALLPAVLFLVLAGCRQQPSFADLLDGDAAAGPRGVRATDGSIVALGVAGITDLSPLADLARLQSLAVAGSFASLQGMGEHPELLRFRIASSDRRLHSLRGLRAPRLEELEVRFANLSDDLSLDSLPELRALRLIDVGLRRVPSLDSPRLERLELRDNDIGTIAGMRDLPALRILDLEGPPLRGAGTPSGPRERRGTPTTGIDTERPARASR